MTGRRTPEPTPAEEGRLRALLRLTADTTSPAGAAGALAAARKRFHRRRIAGATAAGIAVAGVAAASVLVATSGGPASPVPTHQIGPYRLTGALISFNRCDSYLRYVRHRAEQLIGPYGLAAGASGLLSSRRSVLHLPLVAPVPAGAFASATQFEDGSAPLGSPPATYSTTNNQVAGVDEPDTVKTNGNLVVTLTGQTLRVLDSGAQVLGSLHLDGDTGGGLLLAGDRAVVLSSADSAQTYGFGGLEGYQGSEASPIARAAVIDLSQPDRPTLLHTFLFDGTAVAARLVDERVRLVLRSDGPRLSFQSPSESVPPHAAKLENRELIATSTLDDWLPAWQTQAPDGATSARHRLSSCDAIARPRRASGLSTVSVVSLDPNATAPGPATSVVAAGDTVYASTGNVYVAGATSSPRQRTGLETRIYEFAASSAGPPRFVAAGTVSGTLLNSYAMDEDSAGLLRVASTTQDRRGRTDSRITVLAAQGRSLTPVGSLDGLGHGQDLRAVRFVGDLAYVVTFRSFDPLYVVDLRDPRQPRIAGQLEQPGYNEFLYPLTSDLLLGVGVQIRHNEPAQLMISTYDVSDPAQPQRVDQAVLAQGFQAASSGFDPHAFLSWPNADLVVAAVPNGGGATAYRVRSDGTLAVLQTLAHDRLNPDRALVVGDNLWATTVSGVITSPLPGLTASAWHAY